MADNDQKTKTAQPFKDEVADTSSAGVGTEPHPAPDAVGRSEKKRESGKTTQRTE